MKKLIYSFLIAAVVLSTHACIKDDGNYDYDDVAKYMPVKVTGIGESYIKASNEQLVIDPVLEGGNEADYDYRWFTVKLKGLAVDTIGREKKLDYTVALQTAEYLLYFQIRNKKYDTYAYYQTSLQTTSEYSLGWYITKEHEGNTEIDLVSMDGTKYLPNRLMTENGSSMPGKPIKTIIQYDNYGVTTPDNEIITGSAFIVAAEGNVHVYDANTMLLSGTPETIFMDADEPVEPTDLGSTCMGGTTVSVIFNGGKLNLQNSWDGRYTERLFRHTNLNRNVCKVMGVPFIMQPGFFLVFDESTRSFKRIQGTFTASSLMPALTMGNYTGGASGQIPDCNNMDYDLVFMKEYYTNQGLGLMKNRTTGKYYGVKFYQLHGGDKIYVLPSIPAPANPISAFIPVPDGANVITAPIRAVNQENGTIYCSHGDNKVYAYAVGNSGDAQGSEKPLLTLPSDEKVTFINDIRYTNDSGGANFKYFVVLTSKGDGWKMYCYKFEGSSADIEAEPDKTYSGTGKAVNVLFRGTKMANSL